MTLLTQRMREELVRRNYAETTIRTYLMAIEEFRRYAKKRLDHLGPEDIRRYQVALLEGKKLAIGTVALRVSALRFFYLKVLKKRALRDEPPYPKHPKWSRRLPTILTPEEMTRLINSVKNLFHYAMLLTMYSAGLRRSELCPTQGQQHRQPANGDPRRARQGRRRSRDSLEPKVAGNLTYLLALDAPENLFVTGQSNTAGAPISRLPQK